MLTLEVGYKTGTGNVMPITVHGVLLDRRDVPIGEQGLYCNTGGIECKGYNGGCPPHAPHFDKLRLGQNYFYIICLEFDVANALKFSAWDRGKSPGAFIMQYADRLTMHYVQRSVTHFENIGYFTLGASNCPGCFPKDCIVIRGGKCSKPKKRRFSLEATGVECDELHHQLFDEELPWWYRTRKYVPCDMFRYAGVFTSKLSSTMDELLEEFVYEDKSYTDEVPDWSIYHIDELTVPDDKHHAGTSYLAYRIPLEEMNDEDR